MTTYRFIQKYGSFFGVRWLLKRLISIKDFSNAKFPEGVVLSISSDLKIEISTDAADISDMKKRDNKNAKEVTLKSGNYVAGKDFNVGTYDIVAVKGSGNVSSSNLFDGGLNEIMGVKKDGMSIKKYKNAILDQDVELSISGVQVKLVPSKYQINANELVHFSTCAKFIRFRVVLF